MIKDILDNNILYGRIVRANHTASDTEFFTREEDELQIGILSYSENYKTGTHFHNRPQGFLNECDEIFIVQEGSARIDFYNNQGVYIKSTEIFAGDLVIIYMGGHNITYKEKSKILLIKKGPYNKILSNNNKFFVLEYSQIWRSF